MSTPARSSDYRAAARARLEAALAVRVPDEVGARRLVAIQAGEFADLWTGIDRLLLNNSDTGIGRAGRWLLIKVRSLFLNPHLSASKLDRVMQDCAPAEAFNFQLQRDVQASGSAERHPGRTVDASRARGPMQANASAC